METHDFIDRVWRRAGCKNTEESRVATEAALQAFGAGLEPELRREVSETLPPALATILKRRSYEGPVELSRVHDEVYQLETASPGCALEHADAVLAVLGEAMGADLRERLCRHLADEYTPVLRAERAPGVRPVGYQVHEPTHPRSTLSEGRPRTGRTLSDWKPKEGP